MAPAAFFLNKGISGEFYTLSEKDRVIQLQGKIEYVLETWEDDYELSLLISKSTDGDKEQIIKKIRENINKTFDSLNNSNWKYIVKNK